MTERKIPNVGDKLTITLTLECITERKIPTRFTDGIADVINRKHDGAGTLVGNLGGGLGGSLFVQIRVDETQGFTLHCDARDQWLAIADALKEQYGLNMEEV